MSSSDPQRPTEPEGSKPPRTREIPVVQPATGATAAQPLPPHPGAIPPAPVQPVDGPDPTGPVGFVPGPPGAGTAPPVRPTPAAVPAPSSAAGPAEEPAPGWPEILESGDDTEERPRKARVRVPTDRATVLGIGLAVLSVVLLELGLAMRWDDLESYWQSIPLWSTFATLCAVLGAAVFVAFAAAGDRLRSGPAWRMAAAGLVGLAVFWLLVVLPVVATDRGFVLTAAVAALGGALWAGPGRKD